MLLTTRRIFTAAIIGLGGLCFTAAPAPTARAADAAGTDAQRAAEVPELRRIRKELETIDTDLAKDVSDPKGYRKEAREAVRKAIDAVNSEVEEYDKDKGK